MSLQHSACSAEDTVFKTNDDTKRKTYSSARPKHMDPRAEMSQRSPRVGATESRRGWRGGRRSCAVRCRSREWTSSGEHLRSPPQATSWLESLGRRVMRCEKTLYGVRGCFYSCLLLLPKRRHRPTTKVQLSVAILLGARWVARGWGGFKTAMKAKHRLLTKGYSVRRVNQSETT